jgi:translation elongation factor EF-4
MSPAEALGAGEVGYLTASIKTVSDTRVGDTVTGVQNPAETALPGFKQAQADGLLRRLPRRRLEVRRPARRAGKAQS